MSFRNTKHKSGFTLLEVLVSVFILGIILAAIYGAYTSNADAIQRAREKGQVNQVARIVLDLIIKDLESALVEVPFDAEVALGLVCEDGDLDGKPADRINFTSLTHTSVSSTDPPTDLCEIGYHLEQGENGQGLILYRRDDPTPDDDLNEGGTTFQLARRIGGLDITFEDAQGESFDSWNSNEGNKPRGLPSLVKIKLTVLDRWGKEHVFGTSVHPALAQTG